MSDLSAKPEALSAEKLKLLGQLLKKKGIAAPHTQVIPKKTADGPCILSFAQQRLWLFDQLHPGSAVYNDPAALRLRGALDVEALGRSLTEIVRRHEILRTTFVTATDQPVQFIHPADELRFDYVVESEQIAAARAPLVDLRALLEEQRESAAQWLIAATAQRSFDLVRGPLLRVLLIQLGNDEHILLLVLHHIISDGMSWQVLFRELAAHYTATHDRAPAALPALPIQYADYAAWERETLQGAALEAHLDYWRRQLADLTTFQLPTDYSYTAVSSPRGALQTFTLPSELSEALAVLSRREGVTLFMTLLAAWQLLLARYSGQDNIVVGTTIAGRTQAETAALIGCFINELVLRADLSGNPTFREALGRVGEVCRQAYAHQDVPFERLVEELQPERDPNRNPLFQVTFDFQSGMEAALELAGLETQPLEIAHQIAKFDLSLSIISRGTDLAGGLEYRVDLFEATTIARMIGHLGTLLEAIVADPDRRIDVLPILTEAEQRQLLFDWNMTQVDFPRDKSIHALFAAQVCRTPDAVAALSTATLRPSRGECTQLTYRELDQRANRLAQHLRRIGVGPEQRVGVCMERSLEVLVGLLGALKAGGAYVPLDPSYPPDRLAFMLDNAQIRILLSQQRLIDRLPAAHDQRPVPALSSARQPPLICLDTDWPVIGAMPAEAPDVPLDSAHMAYVIYTSGSTGRPKGSIISHAALVDYALAVAQRFDLRADDRILQFASLSFDVMVEELYPTWLSGGAVVMLAEGVPAPGAEFQRLIDAERLTGIELPTAYWHEWVYALAHSGERPFAGLRFVIIGGENPLPERLAAWRQFLLPLFNVYGLTETTVTSVVYETLLELPNRDGRYDFPIGRPIANTQVYVLDRHMQPLPVGIAGELYIGGAGLGRGYLNRPDLTAERFIPNPFVEDKETSRQADKQTEDAAWATQNSKLKTQNLRLYRTGDLARYRPDGNVEFIGRVDYQVKVRGFRIELGEVEAVLAQHPAVRETIVIVREDASGDRRLVAYVVVGSGVRGQGSGDSTHEILIPDPQSLIPELRAFLTKRLPDYMVPSAFVALAALPFSPNGKVDRRALPQPDAERTTPEARDAVPRTPVEELLLGIWTVVLRQEPTSIHDDFFALGGHSLLAAQVIARVRETFAIDLSLRALFEAPTIARLAERIAAAQRHTLYALPPLNPASRIGPLPASFAQQRLWFLAQLEPDNLAYSIPMAVRLSGPLNIGALGRALTTISERHEVLRTTFATRAGQLIQIIHPNEELRFTPVAGGVQLFELRTSLVDLRSLPAIEREAELQRLVAAEAQRPFDLAHGPLLRVSLLCLADDEHVLLLNMHHIVADEWSMGVFVRELAALYQADGQGVPAVLPVLAVQYADYAVWQRAWLQGSGVRGQGSDAPEEQRTKNTEQNREHHDQGSGVRGQGSDVGTSQTQNSKLKTQNSPLEAQLDYWKRQLADLTVLELPTDHLRPAVPSFRGANCTFALPAALTAGLTALSRREGVTLFMTTLAAWKLLLARASGQEDIVVGTPVAGRTQRETEDLIGFFVNTLVLRADLSGNPSFRELLGRVREVCLGAYAHQDVPFDQVVDAVQPARDLSRSPLFQVMFSLQNEPPSELALPGLIARTLPAESGTVKFDLNMAFAEIGGKLLGGMEYRVDLFDSSTIARIASHFQTLLEGIVAQPDRQIGDLPLLSMVEQEQLLSWRTARARYPRERCVHELFADQAARTPDAIAVVFDGPQSSALSPQSLTYAELNARANQLAHHLRLLGVAPGVCAGVCMERSPELLVALLSVLKAGGVYIPLDPTYPYERLAFMLEDAQVAVLITTTDHRLTTNDQRPTTTDLRPATCDQRCATSDVRPATSDVRPQSKIVNLDADWPEIAQSARENLPGIATASDVAYIIYTSGTTGRMKGVQVEHHNLINMLLGGRDTLELYAYDRVSCIASFSFDISLFELLGPLIVGAACVLVTAQDLLDMELFAELLDEVTVVHAVPGLMRPLVQHLLKRGTDTRRTWVRTLLVGGDAVPPDLVSDMQAAFPAAQIYLTYGPTEGTIVCCAYHAQRDQPLRTYMIGEPLPNVVIRLYDARRQLVPIGVAGELYIGGSGVTRGYLNQPELTDEKFVMIDGQRWYRSGDMARWLPNGNLAFIGRIDGQVKIRGFRIELGEIETLLHQHPAVREAVVAVRFDRPREARLVAYIVQGPGVRGQGDKETGDDAAVTQNSKLKTQNYPPPQSPISNPQSLIPKWRAFLRERLPEYMIPSAFVTLDAMPLTLHGKVDRKMLPAPDSSHLALDDNYVVPSSPTEETLARIWAEVLRLERVGTADNFFALGGDSILSIQIIARANLAGLHLSPKQIFQYQTIAELAAVVGGVPAVVAEQGLVSGEVPLTPIQRYFFAREVPSPHYYNQALLLNLRRPLDPTLLSQALQHLVRHHDALRLRFTPEVDGWRQTSAASELSTLSSRVDLSNLPPTEQRRMIEQVSTTAHGSLDLARGPLLRALLFDMPFADQPGRLLIVVHHLAVDAISWGVLLEDLQSAYEQLACGDVVALPPKTTSFKHWAERLVAYARSDALRAELDYWLNVGRLPVARLPLDQPGAANTVASEREIVVSLDEEATSALLTEVPMVYQTQINDVLLTALAHAFVLWIGGGDLLIDLEGHGREELFDDVDLSRTVGWFTTIYPVRLGLRGVAEPGAALKTVKEQLRAIPNHGIGYGVLRYLSEDPTVAERMRALPQAQVSFNYLGQSDRTLASDLFGLSPEPSGQSVSPQGSRSHLIDVNIVVAQGQLRMVWAYSENLYRRATIMRLAEDYLVALHEIIAHCMSSDVGGYTPSDFPEMNISQAELDDIIALLGATVEEQE